MKRAWGLLILIALLLSEVSASCSETQIDINSASAEELDRITGIGPVYAERIIENRTYDSLDDLLRVKGIGEKTLEKIKAEGLACVDDSEETEDNSEESNESEDSETEEETEETNESAEFSTAPEVENETDYSMTAQEKVDLPKITAKSIKSEDNTESLEKNLALYGIIAFCLVFGALFLFKTLRRKSKNEFR